jgi:hypothetical protein
VRVHAVTTYVHGAFGQDLKGEDMHCARRVARATGVNYRAIRLGYGMLGEFRARCVAATSGMYDVHAGRVLAMMRAASDGAMPVVSGHLGGELSSRFQIPDSLFSTPEEHFKATFSRFHGLRFRPETVRDMLRPSLGPDVVEQSVRQYKDFFVSQPDPYFHRYFNWDLGLFRRRYIAYQLLCIEQFATVLAPFYDLDFVDFICSLPFALIERQRAYLAMLCQYYPQLARIPNTTTGLPVLPSTAETLRYFMATQYRRFARRRLERLAGWLTRTRQRVKQDSFHLTAESRPVLDHIVQSRDRMAPYLNVDKVTEAVNRQLGGDNSACMGLLGLSAFAAALEMLEDPHLAVRVWQGDAGGKAAGGRREASL